MAVRAIGDRESEAIWLGNVGVVYLNQGRNEDALTHFKAALAIAKELGDRRGEVRHLGNMGSVRLEQGLFDDALTHFEDALASAQEIGDVRAQGLSLGNIGTVHHCQGRYREALGSYEDALTIARDIEDRRSEAFWLTYLCRTHRSEGAIEKASGFRTEAMAVLREIGVKDVLGECLCEHGHLKLHAGEMADEELCEARAIADELSVGPTTDLGKALTHLERAVEAHGRGEKLFYGQCLEDFPQPVREELVEP